ncbi:MAG TPA: hypothetical protein VGC90_07580, partial [Candidatus Limnocylindrales bacterium]
MTPHANGREAGGDVQLWHRVLALLAVISMLIGTRTVWTDTVTIHPGLTVLVMAIYGAILALGVLALTVPTLRAMVLVDLAILVVAIAHVFATYAVHPSPGDEGALTAQAATSLLAGQHVYGVPWPQVFTQPGVGLTKTMDGGGDLTYAYPPLAAILTAVGMRLLPSLPGNIVATAVTTGTLIAGGVALWLLLPVRWRSAGTAVMLAYPLLPGYARGGYPAVVAMVLLIPVVIDWPSTGVAGRLARAGVVRGILLGAACAAQQLAWFFVPFLLVGLFAVRRRELAPRAALLVVARFAAIAAMTFLAINAFFIVRDGPAAWLGGIVLPLTQHGVPHGQGLIDLTYYLTNGSGALDFYSYATLLFAAALVVLSLLFIRTLGPALTVLPWLVFYLSIRSQDGYYLLMTPLWVAAAITVPRSWFAGAWQPTLPRLTSRPGRAALAAALVAPALACLAVAVLTAAPLRMQILGADAHSAGNHGLWRLQVRVENVSSRPLAPHFAVSTNQSMSAYWRADAGPAVLQPHETATYTLVAEPAGGYNPGT